MLKKDPPKASKYGWAEIEMKNIASLGKSVTHDGMTITAVSLRGIVSMDYSGPRSKFRSGCLMSVGKIKPKTKKTLIHRH